MAGSWTRGSWQWSYEGSEPHARIGYEANLVDADAAWLTLTYTASGTPMDYRVLFKISYKKNRPPRL